MFLHLPESKKIIPLFVLLIFLCGTISCKKKTQNENQENQNAQIEQSGQTEVSETETESETDSDFDFYSPACDNGEWVEELLARLEEERIADELSSMESSLSEYQNEEMPEAEKSGEETEATESTGSTESEESSEPQLSEVEKFFNQEKADTIIHDKNNKLKFYEFENEIFEPQYQNGNLINIHANGNYIDRYFYNDNYQLVKKENWNIPSVQGAKLEKTEKYEYYPDSNVISKKTITTLESQENLTYSETSKILTSEKYAIAEEKNQITSKRKLSYDNEDRLISDSLTEYFYKDKEYKELDYSFTKKYDYAYNEGEIPPDFKYYENGVLKMLNKYSSEKGKYVSEIFFDKTFSVKTYYENDVRVKDVFYNGGKVTREKLYDKMD